MPYSGQASGGNPGMDARSPTCVEDKFRGMTTRTFDERL